MLRGILSALCDYALVPPCVPGNPPLCRADCQGRVMRKCSASAFFRRSYLLVSGSGSFVMVSYGLSLPRTRGICPGTQGGRGYNTRPYNEALQYSDFTRPYEALQRGHTGLTTRPLSRHTVAHFKRGLTILRFYVPFKQT